MINKYNQFLFENYLEEIENIPLVADSEILESIIIDSDLLMNTVNAESHSFEGEPFNFNILKYDNNYTLEQLRDNPDFNENLSEKELFISELNYTKDYDTFIVDDIKYLLIHKRDNREMNRLEKLKEPLYVIFQTKNVKGEWNRDNIKIYKINGNFDNFYKKLSSKTIELTDKDDKKYIYVSNGKNWILKNIENRDDNFKDIMTNDEIKNLLKDEIMITIVS